MSGKEFVSTQQRKVVMESKLASNLKSSHMQNWHCDIFVQDFRVGNTPWHSAMGPFINSVYTNGEGVWGHPGANQGRGVSR